ncbi:MAG TPA: glycerol-3-phosphate 1-O-acyltransferase PlsY [Candidatus Binataceae bacterium]|jgi:glycerol-3-phosphate acyltransferase PlsY|nr:glycerol-3-phosphate 1-O-acyltransferase PlsY [Candidatus Binataceae bacterium]
MLTLASLSVLLAAYLIGSIPVGVLVGKAFGFDPRAVGSHNIGMTNVGRAGGRAAAALTLVGDVLKGLVPILMGQALHVCQGGLALIALATLVGAVYSIFLGFSGGRGVAAAFGIWLGLAPTSVAMVLLAVFVVVLALSRIVSLGSVSAALVLPIAVALCSQEQYFLMSLAMTALVLWRHRENIERLAAGREPAVGSGGKESSAA